MRRLAELREQAVEYLERHLGFQIPDEVAHGVPPRDLLLVASQKGKRRTYACIVLKVMHVMHHLAGRELLTKLPVSADQIFHLVEEKVLRTVEELKTRRLPDRRVRVEPQARRQPDHQAARQEGIDRGRRLRQAALPHDHEHRGAAGVRDARADPAPGPVQLRDPGPVGERHHPIRETLDRSPALRRFLPEITDLAAVAADKKPSPQNEFSGPGYRVINFVADLPVRMDKFLCRTPDDPLFSENGTIVFVLTEFQIIDARTAENNESGENSHEKYKERQMMRVKAAPHARHEGRGLSGTACVRGRRRALGPSHLRRLLLADGRRATDRPGRLVAVFVRSRRRLARRTGRPCETHTSAPRAASSRRSARSRLLPSSGWHGRRPRHARTASSSARRPAARSSLQP